MNQWMPQPQFGGNGDDNISNGGGNQNNGNGAMASSTGSANFGGKVAQGGQSATTTTAMDLMNGMNMNVNNMMNMNMNNMNMMNMNNSMNNNMFTTNNMNANGSMNSLPNNTNSGNANVNAGNHNHNINVNVNNGNHGMQNNNSFSMPMQGGGGHGHVVNVNNNAMPNNSQHSAANAVNSLAMSMNGSMNMGGGGGGGFPQTAVFQVKTGESMHPFLNMGQQQQQQGQGQGAIHHTMPNPTYSDHNHSINGGNNGNGNPSGEIIARSSSEPLLNTMLGIMGNEEPFEMGLHGHNDQATSIRSASTDMLSTMQQLVTRGGGGGGIDNMIQNNQNHPFESNSNISIMGSGKTDVPAMGNTSNNMNNVNMNILHSGGGNNGGGNTSTRRHSEPAFNFLAELFDEPKDVVDSPNNNNNVGSGNINMNNMAGGSGSNNHSNMMARTNNTGDGWSSPQLQETTALGIGRSSVNNNNKTSRQRSNSAPLISEMMFDLHNLEPETVFDEPANNTGEQLQLLGNNNNITQLQRNDLLGTIMVKDMPRNDMSNINSNNINHINSNNIETRRTSTGKVKRSRSVDPLEMFRREDDDTGLTTQSAHDLINPHDNNNKNNNNNDGGPHDDSHKGLSTDDQQKLESMGVYSRDKPKRRRSAPLLSQDIFEDFFNVPEDSGSGNGNGNNNENDISGGNNTQSQNSSFGPSNASSFTSDPGPQNSSFVQGPGPQNPSAFAPGSAPSNPSSFATGPAPPNNPGTQPQDLQQKNNLNLIQMLLGIESGPGASSAPDPGTNNPGPGPGGTTQHVGGHHQQQGAKPANQMAGLNAILGAANPGGNSSSQVIHQQAPKQIAPAPQAQQLLQLNDGPMANTPASRQQLTSSIHSTPSTPVIGSLATTPVPQLPMSSNVGLLSNNAPLPQQQMPLANNAPLPQQQIPLANNAPLPQQQIPFHSNGFMNNINNHVANQGMFNNQQGGATQFAAPPQTIITQAPPPFNINNTEDLTLVLSAVKETQTNLRTLQPMVMQLGDPAAMEEIAKAFKITASSSQFVLTSDLPSAYASLNDAWARIKKLEERLAQAPRQQQQQQFLNMTMNNPNIQMMMLAQAANQNQMVPGGMAPGMINPLMMAMPNPMPVHSSNNSFLPAAPMETAPIAAKPLTPTSGPKPAAVQSAKPSSVRSKAKSKAKAKKVVPSPPPSPVEDVVKLEDLPEQNKDDADVIMKRLQGLMERTQKSQKQLQRWDKKNGLPKSHSQTMVNSSRSRKQLQNGVILKKWNGDPLIAPTEKPEGQASSQDQLEEKASASQDQMLDEQTKEKPMDMEVIDTAGSSATVSSEITFDNEKPGRKKSDDDTTSLDASEIFSEDLPMM